MLTIYQLTNKIKIVDEFQPGSLANYSDTIIEFNRLIHDKAYKGDMEGLEIDVSDLLYDLLKKWSAFNNTIQLWINAKSEYCGDVIFIHANDEASEVWLEILINKDGIYLEMNITCPQNLVTMPDDFWFQMLELNHFGNFELIEHEPFNDKDVKRHPELFPEKSSNIFQLMRGLIAYPLLYDWPIEMFNLSVHWPYDQFSIDEVFEKGCLAFERLWLLNKRLRAGK